MKAKSSKRQNEIPLSLECIDEELTSDQLRAYSRAEEEYKELQRKLDAAIKYTGAEILEKGEGVAAYEYLSTLAAQGSPVLNAISPSTKPGPLSRQTPATPTALQNGVIIQNPVTPSGVTRTAGTPTYQLMMDPRLGLVAVTSPQSTATTPVIQTATSLAKTSVVGPRSGGVQVRTRLQTSNTTPVTTPRAQATPTRMPAPAQKSTPKTGAKTPASAGSTPTTPATKAKKTAANKPTEGNSIGGLSAGRSKTAAAKAASASNVAAPIVDLTDDDPPSSSSPNSHAADSREVTFNKLSGKTFPSLVVVARPNLRLKEIPQAIATEERAELDSKVKNVLMYTPTKFSEWLIQQGLVRSDQCCSLHYNGDVPYKLKLGMYSDVSKFPYSGGYVWISECCPQRFVSVFSGSIFEGAPHPPTVLLKLIYHWACQTSVQNVVQWVKVDNFYVKNFYTNMRSVCTVAIYEKYEKMGGKGKKVEVGVISLGTTSQDGSMRQVKVEVLGVMDAENKFVRLRAVEPLLDGERNYKRRFVKILEPLETWVDKDSQIMTDFTVDKGTLNTMGFKNVTQISISENPNPQKTGNQNIMEYLRRIVPRMFQNTLSLLSRQIIQQFLDELVWRERWGPTAPRAFDNLVAHIAEQTKLDTSDSLLVRLGKVASNPFKNWNYSAWKPPIPPVTNGTATTAAKTTTATTTKTTPAAATKTTPAATTKTTPAATTKPTTQTPAAGSTIDLVPQSIRDTPGPKRKKRPAGDTISGPDAKKPAVDVKKAGTPDVKKAVPVDTKKPAVLPAPVEEQTYLDSYYYGTLEGDSKLIQGEFKSSLDMKCCACHRKFTNNISFMKHIIMHVQSNSEFNMELSDLTQCKYCLKSFDTPFTMQSHVEEIHMRRNSNMFCRICEEKFLTRETLINHMHRNHVAMELPYECEVCKFRSSLHRDVIDHFYEVHNGGEKLQCPFCLKVVSVSNKGKKISANVNFFLNHLLKHQRKSIARKCNKCSMWFVHKGILREHQDKAHSSYKGTTGVKSFVNPSGMDILMPVPAPEVPQGRGPQPKRGSPKPKLAYNMVKYETLTIRDGRTDDAKCCECEGHFCAEDHFVGYMQCTRCQYATSCSKAMTEHAVVFHEIRKPSFVLGKVVQLPKDMFCVCGYKTASGNRLANHLAVCKRKSAYPNTESAKASTVQSASFPPLINLDDVENSSEDPSDRWLKAFVPTRKEEEKSQPSKDIPERKPTKERSDPPSMLNILGLVRKASTDEPNQDQSPTETDAQSDAAKSDVADTEEAEKLKKVDSIEDEAMDIDNDTESNSNQSNDKTDLTVTENISSVEDSTSSIVEQQSHDKDTSDVTTTMESEEIPNLPVPNSPDVNLKINVDPANENGADSAADHDNKCVESDKNVTESEGDNEMECQVNENDRTELEVNEDSVTSVIEDADCKNVSAENEISTSPDNAEKTDPVGENNVDNSSFEQSSDITQEANSSLNSPKENNNLDEESSNLEQESSNLEQESSNLEQESSNLDQESSDLDQESSNVDRESGNLDRESGNLDRESGNLDRESGNLDQESVNLDQESSNLDQAAAMIAEEFVAADNSSIDNVTNEKTTFSESHDSDTVENSSTSVSPSNAVEMLPPSSES